MLLVASMTFVKDFMLQFALVQAILMSKALWFLHRMPYTSLKAGISDIMNDLFLVAIHSCLSWITLYVADDEFRYSLGWYYSGLICIMFLANFGLVGHSVFEESQLKRQKEAMRKRKEAEIMRRKREREAAMKQEINQKVSLHLL